MSGYLSGSVSSVFSGKSTTCSIKSGQSSTDGKSRDARSCESEDKAIEEEEEVEEVVVRGSPSRGETRVKAFLSEFQVPCCERNIRVFSEVCGIVCKTFVTPSRLINAPT